MSALSATFRPEIQIAPAPRYRMRSTGLYGGAALTAVFGFIAFMPYPAIPVGDHTGIQIGNLLALAIVAVSLLFTWKNKPYFFFPLLMMPACISLVKVAFTNDGDLDLCFKAIATTAISGIALIATQFLAPRYSLSLMKGIAWAVIVHTVVGFCQMYYFAQGQFPLLPLYVNPSFLSVQDNAQTIARYIQRPFGIFPEPSAMSSSLAPVALFWLAELFGLVRLRQTPTRGQRILFTTASIGALALIILSRSGHAMVTLMIAGIFALIWLARSRATVRSYLAVLGVFGIALPVLVYLLIQSISTRMDGPVEVDQSWQDRASSLWVGFSLLMDSGPSTLIFGMGPGMLSPRMASSSDFDASLSISLSFLYQTGFIGLCVTLWLLRYLARVWRRSGHGLVFFSLAGLWLFGITITTSYGQLLPIWVWLGWLTVWPSVCAPERRIRGKLRFT